MKIQIALLLGIFLIGLVSCKPTEKSDEDAECVEMEDETEGEEHSSHEGHCHTLREQADSENDGHEKHDEDHLDALTIGCSLKRLQKGKSKEDEITITLNKPEEIDWKPEVWTTTTKSQTLWARQLHGHNYELHEFTIKGALIGTHNLTVVPTKQEDGYSLQVDVSSPKGHAHFLLIKHDNKNKVIKALKSSFKIQTIKNKNGKNEFHVNTLNGDYGMFRLECTIGEDDHGGHDHAEEAEHSDHAGHDH